MKLLLGLAALPLAASALHAQRAVPDRATLFAQIDALPVDAMCRNTHALQYAFGGTEAPPSLMRGFETRGLTEKALPFERVSFANTKWSGRFIGATYTFDAGDKATAHAAIERLAAHFRKRGWIERKGGLEEDGPMIDFPPGPGEVAFYSAETARQGPGRKGVRASLTALGGELSFSCEGMAEMETQMGEAFGDLPPGTPRPIAPVALRPESLDPAACTTPEGQARMRGYAKGDDMDVMTRFLLERTQYSERLVTWKTDRLKKSGKVSEDRLMKLMMAGFDGNAGNPLAALSVITDMLGKAQEIAKLDKAGDVAGACRAMVEMMGGLEKADKTVSKQWAAMEAALDAEANRVGVSWD